MSCVFGFFQNSLSRLNKRHSSSTATHSTYSCNARVFDCDQPNNAKYICLYIFRNANCSRSFPLACVLVYFAISFIPSSFFPCALLVRFQTKRNGKKKQQISPRSRIGSIRKGLSKWMIENQMKRRMIDKNKYDSGFNQARVHLLSFGQIFYLNKNKNFMRRLENRQQQ